VSGKHGRRFAGLRDAFAATAPDHRQRGHQTDGAHGDGHRGPRWPPDQLPEPHGRESYDRGRARINGMPRTRLSNLLARHWASAVALGITVVMTAGCSHHHAARAASSSFPLVVTTDGGARCVA
jgi:hypothetical protein